MGKARAKEAKMRGARKARMSGGANDNLLRNSVGKISAEISAISLGPPRSKILKKSGSSSSCGRGDPTNFASRGGGESARAKKKVTFSHNLIAEELKQDGHQDDAKRLFRVVHPAAMRRASNNGDGSRNASEHTFISDVDKNVSGIRKLLKDSIKGKRMRIRARRDVFRKKMELMKQTEVESRKAKQREQTVIVGDMHPLLQALPSLSDDVGAQELNETDAGKLDQRTTTKMNKNKFSVKRTRQAILDSLKLFEASGVTTAHHRISKN